MTSFVAIDFETANYQRDSPCGVGVVQVHDGEVVAEWETLINPEVDEFTNTWVHGIAADDVADAPRFPEVLDELLKFVRGAGTLVAHNASFDMRVLTRTAARYGIDLAVDQFACSMVFARNWFPGWQTYSLGYVVHQLGLAEMCGDGGHHNAMWDARGSAHISLAGLRAAQVESWEEAADVAGVRLGQASGGLFNGCVYRRSGSVIRPTVDPGKDVDLDNPLFGVSVAFTGALAHLSRRDAAQLVVDAGAEFSQGVTLSTDLLVVGEQDLERLAGHSTSSKMRKAAKMVAEGHHIEIVGEGDFYKLLGS